MVFAGLRLDAAEKLLARGLRGRPHLPASPLTARTHHAARLVVAVRLWS